MVERFDKMWSTGEENDKVLQYSCLENPMNSRKRQNDRIPKEELPRSLGAQYATGDQWRNNSRMRWLDGITDSMDMSLSELRDGDGQGGLACCDSWGRKESDMTERLN